jgi:monovalent cation:H+ antiporter-2, CPA2 family
MISLGPIISLSLLLVIALAGGMIAHRLRQPIIIGYLLIGILAGPHALGWIKDSQMIEAAASFGVALLMFTVGLEISLTQLRDIGRGGIWGGLLEIALTIIPGAMAAFFIFQWTLEQSIIFGLIISLSSTAICLKILMDRGELSSVHGRIMIAMLILQDISVVIMMVALPLMGTGTNNFMVEMGLALGKSLLFIGAAIVLGQWVLPWLLGDVGGVRARELFLLTVLVLCLGATVGTYLMGLSMVFGAFLIGIILRSTRFAHQALAEVTPLRDIFATLFFVSIGLLLDPEVFISNWGTILIILLVILILKIAVIFAIVRFFGYSNRIALFSGVGLFQVGEFGFVLAQGALDEGIFSADQNAALLSAIVITMILTPFIVSLVQRFYPAIALFTTGKTPDIAICQPPGLNSMDDQGHVVIAGYGRVGQNLINGLENAGIPYVIIDIDPECLSEARICKMPHIYGDASNIHVLMQADLCNAAAMVVTFPDAMAVEATVKNALNINPNLKILARFHRASEARALAKLGVAELVNPEVEAGFKFFKQVLKITGVDKDGRTQLVDVLRRANSKS